MMKKAAGVYARVIPIIVGVLFMVVGLIFFFKFDPKAYDMKTLGTITEIEEYWDTSADDNSLSHRVYIDYAGGGRKFSHVEYGSYDSSMRVGDKVDVYYMSHDPEQFTGPGKDAVPYIGLAFAVAGFALTGVTVFKRLRGR